MMNTFLRNATASKEEEDINLTPHEHERVLMREYRSLRAPSHLNPQDACNETVRINPLLLVYVPDIIKLKKCVIRRLGEETGLLEHVPDHFKTKKMCDKAVKDDRCQLKYVPDHFKSQEICEKAVEKNPHILKFVPDNLKGQEMCEKAIEKDPRHLIFVPDYLKA